MPRFIVNPEIDTSINEEGNELSNILLLATIYKLLVLKDKRYKLINKMII